VVIEHLGGAVGRVGPQETAVSYREALYNAVVIGMWADAAEDERNISWVRAQWEALRPFSAGGVYVNYLGDEGDDRVRAAYGAEKYERLRALKTTYDPTNLFRLNQNIKPMG
jgi:FAD/FMN-containing dehydrogenase